MFFIIFLFPALLNAQVYKAGDILPYYYDINPDTLINDQACWKCNKWDSAYIYVFGNATPDFKIEFRSSQAYTGNSNVVYIVPLKPNVFISWGRTDSVCGNFGYPIPYYYCWITEIANPLQLGDTINKATMVWKNQTLYLNDRSTTIGPPKNVVDFVSTLDRYIAVKYQNTSDTVYGWIRISCPNEDSCYVKDYSLVSSCNSTPTLTTSSSQSIICSGETTTLTASGVSTYTWSTGSNNSSVVITPTASVTYSVSGTSLLGCKASATVPLNVNPNPTLTTSSSQSIICSGESATLTVNGATSYSWSTGSVNTSVIVSPLTTTSYSVNGVNGLGCKADAVITQSVNACIGIKEYEAGKPRIYPSPVQDNLFVELEHQSIIEIEITNYLGQTVLKTPVTTNIDVSKLATGIYYLRITSENKQILYSRFVKE